MYKHYIKIDDNGFIIDGFSSAFGHDPKGFILICEDENYLFHFCADSEENPQLFGEHKVPLYKWDGKKVTARAQKDIDADTEAAASGNTAVPSLEEQFEALKLEVDAIKSRTVAMDQDLTAVASEIGISRIRDTAMAAEIMDAGKIRT